MRRLADLTAEKLEDVKAHIARMSDDEIEDAMRASVMDGESIVVGCESECTTDPDGFCEHGYPAIMVALEMI